MVATLHLLQIKLFISKTSVCFKSVYVLKDLYVFFIKKDIVKITTIVTRLLAGGTG